MITVAGSLALLLAVAASGNVTTPKEINGQRYAPSRSYTSSEIQEDYAKTKNKIAESLRAGMTKTKCEMAQMNFSCLRKEYETTFIPPFVPILDFPERHGWEARDGWVPLSDTFRGKQVFSEWSKRADVGKVFGCDEEGRCGIIVRTPSGDLAKCTLTRARAGAVGAPEDCSLIAVRIDKEHVFLKVVIEGFPLPTGGGREDFSLEVYVLGRPHETSRIEEALVRSLKGDPLNLTTEVQASGNILGISTQTPSHVLKDWRETVTIRLEVITSNDPSGYGTDKKLSGKASQFIGVRVASTLYVNRQNSATPKDWTMPTEAQEALWVQALRKNLHTSLEGLCSSVKWHDDKILECR